MFKQSRNRMKTRPPWTLATPHTILRRLLACAGGDTSSIPWTIDSCFGWWRFRGLLKPCFLVTWQLVETNSKPIWDEKAHTNISNDTATQHHITRLIILSNRSNLIDHANL